MFSIYRTIDVSQHLHYDLQSVKPQTVLLLCSDDGLMLTLLEFALSDLGEGVNHPLQDVFLLVVTVVVVEDL